MRIIIDTDVSTLTEELGTTRRVLPLYSDAAFALLSDQWVKVGWNQRYTHTFAWLGRPIIQLPQDLVQIQEAIFQVRPDVILETGVAHGGSLVFYATLCKAMGCGRVIGIDVEIRPANRVAIESHVLAPLITLIEGDSIAAETIERTRKAIGAAASVMVILDSCHTRAHVAAELHAYARFVTPGSYVVVTDGIMRDLADVPRGQAAWREDNPGAAAREYAAAHPEFECSRPQWPFNESTLASDVTHWPGAWLRRICGARRPRRVT